MTDLPPVTPQTPEPTPLPPTTPGSSAGWVIAFLFFPVGTAIYMRYLRIVSRWLSILLFLLSLAAFYAINVVTTFWPLLAVCLLFYAMGVVQFILGQRKRIWSPRALRLWKSLAWTGAVLVILTPYALSRLYAELLPSLDSLDSLDW